MRLAALVPLACLAACWRDAPSAQTPQLSFVARVEVVGELRRGTDELARRMAAAAYRIHGLASEAERDALLADVRELEREIARLAGMLDRARAGGEDADRLAGFAVKLHEARSAVVELHAEVHHAKTTAELEAFEQLKRKVEGSHDPGFTGRRILFPRDSNVPPVILPRDPTRPFGELPQP